MCNKSLHVLWNSLIVFFETLEYLEKTSIAVLAYKLVYIVFRIMRQLYYCSVMWLIVLCDMLWNIKLSHSRGADDLGLLECDAISLGERVPRFYGALITWSVTLWHWMSGSDVSEYDDGATVLWNVKNHFPSDATLHPRRPRSHVTVFLVFMFIFQEV